MKCLRPDICALKAAAFQEYNNKFLSSAQERLEKFQAVFEQNMNALVKSNHGDRRQIERSFSNRHIREAVLYGWAISTGYDKATKWGSITIMYNIKVAPRVFRPVHVVCGFNDRNPNLWTVITAYDPRTHEYKWANGYTQRICFCEVTE